jgi:hypothetical protein
MTPQHCTRLPVVLWPKADWDNAILVLNRLLQTDKNNLEYNKDVVQCYYFKRDYEKQWKV